MSKTLLRISFVILAVMQGTVSFAAGDDASELSLFVGSLLPNQIEGVTEILPVFGGRYGFHALGGMTEIGLFNSRAQGTDFTTLGLSVRGDLPAVDGFSLGIYGGFDLHYYRQVNTENRLYDYGVHLGAAGQMHVNETLWLRSDLKFLANPGTALLLLFGVVFR